MGTPSQYFIDPSLGSDTGDGSVGTPWGRAAGEVIQWALDTGITRDATNGDQINVKAGTDDVLGAILSYATYGTPTVAAPIIFRGYTTTAADGGIGGISGNGSVGVEPLQSHVHFIDMHLHDCGSVDIVGAGAFCLYENVEFDNTTGDGLQSGSECSVVGCNFHDISGLGIRSGGQNLILYNYFKNGTKDFAAAALAPTGFDWVEGNIISIDGTSNGIESHSSFEDPFRVINNSVFSAGGSGIGIEIHASGAEASVVMNNIVEGFSSVGSGFHLNSNVENMHNFKNNATFNCTTPINSEGDVIYPSADNELLGDSPFDKSGADTFANRFTYFAPVDIGNVRGGAYPSGCRRDKGAVQHADPAGGGGLRGILTGGRL